MNEALEAEAPEKPVERRPPILQPRRVMVGYAGHFWSTYQCIAEEAHRPEDALTSNYWAHVATERNMRVNDRLEVRSETGEWALDLIVTQAGAKHVRVRPTWAWKAEETAPADEQGLRLVAVRFKGPVLKHCIVRVADNEILKEGIAAKADAFREALDFERNLAG